MSENPYDPPLEPSAEPRAKRESRLVAALAILAVPAASIAGGVTCAAVGTGLQSSSGGYGQIFPVTVIAGALGLTVAAFTLAYMPKRGLHVQKPLSGGWIAARVIAVLGGLLVGGFGSIYAFVLGMFLVDQQSNSGTLGLVVGGLLGGTFLCLLPLLADRMVMSLARRISSKDGPSADSKSPL
jgi:hypothetical protein